MNNATTLELVTFKSAPDTSPEQMANAALAVTIVLKNYDGFISRSFAEADDGTWIDAVYWRDRVSAKRAAEAVMQDPIAQVFFALIDQKTMVFKHANITAQVNGSGR